MSFTIDSLPREAEFQSPDAKDLISHARTNLMAALDAYNREDYESAGYLAAWGLSQAEQAVEAEKNYQALKIETLPAGTRSM